MPGIAEDNIQTAYIQKAAEYSRTGNQGERANISIKRLEAEASSENVTKNQNLHRVRTVRVKSQTQNGSHVHSVCFRYSMLAYLIFNVTPDGMPTATEAPNQLC